MFGYRTMTMLTASMAPEIEPGDVTIVTPIDVSEVTEGMVITYHQPIDDHASSPTGSSRSTTALDGTVTVQTKGDANEANDPWTATLEGDTAYQVQAVIPELGHLIQALRTPVVTQVLLYGAPTLLVGWLLLTIWRPTRDEEDDVMTSIRRGPGPARPHGRRRHRRRRPGLGHASPRQSTVTTTISTTTVAAPANLVGDADLRPTTPRCRSPGR